MKKKRSIGVAFFGWLSIVSGVSGFFMELNPMGNVRIYGTGLSFLNIVLCLASFICGIFILDLNSKARKAIIYLCLLTIVLIPIYLLPLSKSFNFETYYQKKKQIILEQLKPEYQQKALEALEERRNVSKKMAPIVLMIILGVPWALLELIPVYFFTRPKVKEQFS